jgi:hypothetical protein
MMALQLLDTKWAGVAMQSLRGRSAEAWRAAIPTPAVPHHERLPYGGDDLLRSDSLSV